MTVEIGTYGGWGDKGQAYRPDKCDHAADDGCMWCCQRCNQDRHWCPGCGTVTDRKGSVCGDGQCCLSSE